jgi:hypothetical protein
MKPPIVTGTESIGFTGEEARDRAKAEMKALRAEGIKHVSLYTSQIDKKMTYIVTWPKQPPTQAELIAQAEADLAVLEKNKPIVPLPESEESAKMVDEGGPIFDEPPKPFRGKVDLHEI